MLTNMSSCPGTGSRWDKDLCSCLAQLPPKTYYVIDNCKDSYGMIIKFSVLSVVLDFRLEIKTVYYLHHYGLGKIKVKPEKIDWISEAVISIGWDNGEKTICFTKTLRQNCPCAICQETREKREPLVVISSDQKHIELTGWRFIGNYAVALTWSDGHDTGIYTYEFLRQLCEDE